MIMGYFFYLALVLSITITSGYELSEKTCVQVENPLTFEVYELICLYKGPGLYELTGPKSLRVLKMDRLTAQSHLRVEVDLQEINIKEGQCKYITAPATVMVFVGDQQCIASTTMETTSSRATSTASSTTSSRAPSTASSTTSESRAPSTPTTTDDQFSTEKNTPTTTDDQFSTENTPTTTDDQFSTENTPTTTDDQFSTLQTSSASGQDSSNDEKTTPWIVSTIVAITEYIEHCVVTITILVISCRHIMTFIENAARNAQPPLLMAAPAPLQLHQIPGPQQPAVPQQPLAQQHPVANQQPARPLRRGQRVRRVPKRLTY